MRTFKITPASPGQTVHHMWNVVAVEEDGGETTIETYANRDEAEAARLVLEREEMDIPP